MSDVEVGLARAMLAKGMKNDQVHFYFNRADRLISSGRIAQIKDGSYAKNVVAAGEDELTMFAAKWDAELAAIYPKARNHQLMSTSSKLCSKNVTAVGMCEAVKPT
jgi:hypothetical protein